MLSPLLILPYKTSRRVNALPLSDLVPFDHQGYFLSCPVTGRYRDFCHIIHVRLSFNINTLILAMGTTLVNTDRRRPVDEFHHCSAQSVTDAPRREEVIDLVRIC